MEIKTLPKHPFTDGIFEINGSEYGVRAWLLPDCFEDKDPFGSEESDQKCNDEPLKKLIAEEIEEYLEQNPDFIYSNVDRVWFRNDKDHYTLFTMQEDDFRNNFQELITGVLMCAYIQATMFRYDEKQFMREKQLIKKELSNGIDLIKRITQETLPVTNSFYPHYLSVKDRDVVGEKLIMCGENKMGMLAPREFYIAKLNGQYLLSTGPNGAKGVCTLWAYDVCSYWNTVPAFGKDNKGNLNETVTQLDAHEGNIARIVAGASLLLVKTAEKITGASRTGELMEALDYFVEQILKNTS